MEEIQIQNRKLGEASRILNVSVYTLRDWLRQRRIAYVKMNRSIRIPDTEIQRFLNENTIPAAPRSRSRNR